MSDDPLLGNGGVGHSWFKVEIVSYFVPFDEIAVDTVAVLEKRVFAISDIERRATAILEKRIFATTAIRPRTVINAVIQKATQAFATIKRRKR